MFLFLGRPSFRDDRDTSGSTPCSPYGNSVALLGKPILALIPAACYLNVRAQFVLFKFLVIYLLALGIRVRPVIMS
jgi:hypothetical protein